MVLFDSLSLFLFVSFSINKWDSIIYCVALQGWNQILSLNHLTKNFYLKNFIKLQLIFTFLDEVNHQNLPVCVCFKYMLMLVKIRSKKGPEISFPNRQILRVSGTLVKVIWVSAALLISIYMVFIFKICHP